MNDQEKIKAVSEVLNILQLEATNEQKAEMIVNLRSSDVYNGKSQAYAEIRESVKKGSSNV